MIKFLLRFVVAVVAIGTLSSALYLSSVDFVVPDTNSVLVGIVMVVIASGLMAWAFRKEGSC